MAWLMFALGLALAAGGGAAVVHGYPYMQVEFGWTEVIAGTTALSGGIVTVGIAALLVSLARLRRAMERSALAPALPIEAAPQPPAMPENLAVSVLSQDMIRADEKQSPSLEPEIVAVKKPEERRERVIAKRPEAARQTREAPARPMSPVTIAGRYEANGSSYVLFSDGTIEVESGAGKRRFGSMDELKTFMAQEKPESVSPDA